MAFKRATVSSLGGVGNELSTSSLSAVVLFSKVWIVLEEVVVAFTKLKVFFFMRQNLQVMNRCNKIGFPLDTNAT
jgi:hypothetical protein